MSSTYVNVINTTPFTGSALPGTFANPGMCLVWASTGTQTNNSGSPAVQTNYICQSSQTLMLDGYDGTSKQTGGCYTFTGILNFTLNNPIYTDDENDLCLLYVVFPKVTAAVSGVNFNSNTSFNVTCSMHNLGSAATSPVYQLTTNTPAAGGFPYLVIPINKWFAFRAPGSIYQLRINGLTNTLCSVPGSSANTCACNVST